MDVAFLKIGRYGFPYPDFGMHPLDSLPCGKTYASTMDMGRNKEQIQMTNVRLFIYTNDHASHLLAITDNTVRLRTLRINRTLNGFSADNFSIFIKVVIPHTELLRCAIFERFLIVTDKLFPIIVF